MQGVKTHNLIQLCKEVIEKYSNENIGIEATCKSFNLNYRTFKRAIDEMSDLSSLYKQAQIFRQFSYNEVVVDLALSALQQKLTTHTVIEIRKQMTVPVKKTKNGKQKEVLATKTEITKVIEPDMTAIQYALNNLAPSRFKNGQVDAKDREQNEATLLEQRISDMSFDDIFRLLHKRNPEPGEYAIQIPELAKRKK